MVLTLRDSKCIIEKLQESVVNFPEYEINLWYDSRYVKQEQIIATRRLLDSLPNGSKINLKDYMNDLDFSSHPHGEILNILDIIHQKFGKNMITIDKNSSKCILVKKSNNYNVDTEEMIINPTHLFSRFF